MTKTSNSMPRKGQFIGQDKAAALFKLYMAAAWENTVNPCPVLSRIVAKYEALLASLEVSVAKAA